MFNRFLLIDRASTVCDYPFPLGSWLLILATLT